mgnify:CR=1 FL=1|tara:strand:- start:414 stop:785 length:372 start_codon:yes stop_codon:yes gene_type:complete
MSDREIMNAKNGISNTNELADKYPDIYNAYMEIQQEQFELFSRKMLDYGKGNISVGSNLETIEEEKIALTGLWFRMNDKIQRLKQLVLLNNNPRVETESVKDTFQDLSIYGIIAQIVKDGNWK